MSVYNIKFTTKANFIEIVACIEQELIEISVDTQALVKTYSAKINNLNNSLKKLVAISDLVIIYAGLDIPTLPPLPQPITNPRPTPYNPFNPYPWEKDRGAPYPGSPPILYKVTCRIED